MFYSQIIRYHTRVNRPVGLGIACVMLAILLAGCAATPMIGSPLEQRKLKAGTYEGVYMEWGSSLLFALIHLSQESTVDPFILQADVRQIYIRSCQ